MTGLTGAEALISTAAGHGIAMCFANPGTTEMPLVAALDHVPGIRAVLGLQENVCTGAADGYARITGQAALTLLHLGPGLANGLANLHNARRAHTPVVNVVGDHASWHLPYDTPLTSDIAALAGTVGSVHQVGDREKIQAVTGDAIEDAHNRRGVATIIFPADFQIATAPAREAGRGMRAAPGMQGEDQIEKAATALRQHRDRAVLLLGGNALTRAGQQAAGGIAAATGARRDSETFPARAERGGGLPPIGRLPYFPEPAAAALGDATVVVTAGAAEPVTYFGYPGIPSTLARQGTLLCLAGPGEDAERALEAIAGLLAGLPDGPGLTRVPGLAEEPQNDQPLSGHVAGVAIAASLPEHAIVSIEGGTCGYPFYSAAARSAPHTVLTNTGGAIGQGLPVALGAAIAAPERPVLAVQSDGSALYTAQALWTMSREATDVVILIAANNAYNVLRTELARDGRGRHGRQAQALTSLDSPRIDWVALATGYGVPASRAATAGQLRQAVDKALAERGPHLIEMVL